MPTILPSIQAILFVLAGIILSIVLPLAVKALQKARGLEKKGGSPPSFGDKIKDAWIRYGGNKYLIILFAGVLIAVVIVFLLGMQFYTPRDAILAGFAWESLLNKTFGPNQSKPA